jgi:hypothetical protein
MYIVAGMLVVGLIANLLVRPVDPRFHHHPSDEADSSAKNS